MKGDIKMSFRKCLILSIIILFTVMIFNGIAECSEMEAGNRETGTNKQDTETKAPENWYDDLFFKDDSFTFQFIRVLGSAYGGGADLGECVQTARRIKEGVDESWFREWSRTANRVYEMAKKFEKEDHTVSAREAYFRACNYYRSAGFYMHSKENIAKSIITWSNSRESFRRAISSLDNVKQIKIPYQGITLPGYFIKTKNGGIKPPLLIVHTGFDGTGEELYFSVGQAAAKRGYNCLIFEGPGQGAALRKQNLHFRYDWEKVVTPVVDYALKRPDVDENKIALMGISMGGYLAPRAMAFEHRIKACIANGGVYDFSAPAYKAIGADGQKLLETDPAEFNKMIEEFTKKSTYTRWFYNNGMWAFGAKSPADLMLKIKKYNLKGVAQKIRCRMLVINSEADTLTGGQAQKLYDKLTCPKEFILFAREQTAQAHCQMGARGISNEIIFNWLDRVFGK